MTSEEFRRLFLSLSPDKKDLIIAVLEQLVSKRSPVTGELQLPAEEVDS